MELFVESGGATPLEAVQIATIASADILRLGRIVGRVAENYVANLVVLSKNPLENISNTRSIEMVVHNGNRHKPPEK